MVNHDEVVTFDSAIKNAARLLYYAEMDTDLNKMERMEHLADSWVAIAGIIYAREATAEL